MSAPKLSMRLVVAVTSATALLEINKIPSLIRAISGLQAFWPTLPLTVAASASDASPVSEILERHKISHELLRCDPIDPRAFAVALAPECEISDALLIHDASRPLTSPEQFSRILAAFEDSVDAVRPTISFTETLKIIKSNSIIRETLDRTKVKRISTPELIRNSAIDVNGQNCGWFLPLKKSAQTVQIEGSPEALRINSSADRELLESFLHWRQRKI